MRNYQLTYLVNPDLQEEDLTRITEKINSFVSEQSGLLDKSTGPEKRQLGHEVEKKREAFLISTSFSLKPENIEDLKKHLDSEENILRYTLAKKEISKEKPARTRGVKKPKEEKVDLGDIDKKIDQILE